LKVKGAIKTLNPQPSALNISFSFNLQRDFLRPSTFNLIFFNLQPSTFNLIFFNLQPSTFNLIFFNLPSYLT